MNIFKYFVSEKKNKTRVFEISLEKLSAAFDQMRNQAGWDTSRKLYWGYYFLDHDIKKLEFFVKILSKHNLYNVELRNTGKDNLYILHAEEHAIHTAESLFDQCNQLARLASKNNIEIFDGWDVEKIKLDKGLVE